jgi:hypothetical protein
MYYVNGAYGEDRMSLSELKECVLVYEDAEGNEHRVIFGGD